MDWTMLWDMVVKGFEMVAIAHTCREVWPKRRTD